MEVSEMKENRAWGDTMRWYKDTQWRDNFM